MIPPELERAVLIMVRNGGGKASWHRLATRLPSFDVPLVPDLMTVLTDLKARGLVTQTHAKASSDSLSGNDRWAITPLGEAALDAPAPAPGPLSPEDLARFTAAVHAGLASTVAAVQPLIDDGLRLWAVLRQLLAANPGAAQRVAELGLFLPERERAPFARELLDDGRAEVRAALFRAWTPVRTDVPGDPLPTVADVELDDLLRRGMLDPDNVVREAAAALAFLAVRGPSLIGELTMNLGSASRGVRWWSTLALGAARDPVTRALLIETAQGADVALAAAAVRALGQRADGHAAWLAALSDPRSEVHNAASFALSTVVTGLSDQDLAAVARDQRPAVQHALAAYRRRVGRS